MDGCIVLPSLLARNAEEMREKLAICEGAVETAHIDIADGVFVPNKSWADPRVIGSWGTTTRFELHLMVDNPYEELQKWTSCKSVSRFIVHPEARQAPAQQIAQLASTQHWEAGIGMRLDTNPAAHTAFINALSPAYILCMGINHIGFSGEPLDIPALEDLVLSIHDTYEQAEGWRWEIDGGVHEKDIRRLWRMGFSDFVVASEIFTAPEPRKKIEDLRDVLTHLPEPDYDWVYSQKDTGNEYNANT